MATGRDDKALVAAARKGDAAAFEELVSGNRERIFWVARQVVGNAEDARDVAQNTLIRLWRNLDRYDERYAFSTWIYRMTVNLAIDHLRRQAPRQKETELDDHMIEVLPGGDPGPERAAREHEVARIFDELSAELPPQQRAVFALRELQGLTSTEVGEILDLSASTVRNHLFQARRTLRRELQRRYPDYMPARAEESPS